ncbi:MAG TPA: magnesium transporter CorA family protein [Candidatus Limnocylindrales bacterium]|nr:magnesium transporter CorA family protein [Candidatus Limnocylindrales bacterium]
MIMLRVMLHAPAPLSPAPAGCRLEVVEFDFAAKTLHASELARFADALEQGRYTWIDVDVQEAAPAAAFLAELELVDAALVGEVASARPDTRLSRFDDYLFLALTGCRIEGERLAFERVSAVISEHFLLTVHHGPVRFLDQMKREYRSDFVRFAKGPSFLIYELLEHLTENYIDGQSCLLSRVEALQAMLIGDVEDSVFAAISELGNDVLSFRKVLVPARSVMNELHMRKSAFVSDETRPFLADMEATVERVLTDVLADREILSGSLDLYMSMVSHRTNAVMKRLTAVSVIFLPLTFLCGVYGMNFRVLPELEWQYGYAAFWAAALALAGTLVWLLRRGRLL